MEVGKKKGYLIWAPDFVGNSAGGRCLYMLCDRLNQRGYPSYIIFSTLTTSELEAPIMSVRRAQKLLKTGECIAVYPEVIPGNPLGAKYVVRWVLNKPGLLGGTELYDENERIFYYSDVYKRYIRDEIDGKLYMPTLDVKLFYDDGRPQSERKLQVYYVGKSVYQSGFVDKDQALEITRQFPSRESLGDIFRSSSVFYCFDNSSVIVYEAILCGCPVVIIPDGTQVREDYELLELGMGGIGWGPKELDRARSSVGELQQKLIETQKQLEIDLDHFIDKTQNWKSWKAPDKSLSFYQERENLQKKFIQLYTSISYTIAQKVKILCPTFEERMKKMMKKLGSGGLKGLKFFSGTGKSL